MTRDVYVDLGSVNYIQKVSIGPHSFHADEPHDVGGTDAGPNPEELLLASLGACVSITVQMYAGRKRWSLEAVHVDLRYERVRVENGTGAWIQAEGIEVQISISGNLTEDQRLRLLQIAERCPVHRLLSAPIPIHTSLIDLPGSVGLPSSLSASQPNRTDGF